MSTNEINSLNRDEFIYTQVFNNYNIPVELPIDFTLGSIAEWSETCNKFNNGEMILEFALIYIVNGNIICNNLHPFSNEKLHPFSNEKLHPFSNENMSEIIDLFHAHKINN
uniref:Uncharacterized protein n=1 Tax=viral metagenome TaxID=1070528 RepID=A0A6C0IIP3_9ZZZZ